LSLAIYLVSYDIDDEPFASLSFSPLTNFTFTCAFSKLPKTKHGTKKGYMTTVSMSHRLIPDKKCHPTHTTGRYTKKTRLV
jgi:hypothetical protein